MGIEDEEMVDGCDFPPSPVSYGSGFDGSLFWRDRDSFVSPPYQPKTKFALTVQRTRGAELENPIRNGSISFLIGNYGYPGTPIFDYRLAFADKNRA